MAKKSKHINQNLLLTKQEARDATKRLGFKRQKEFAKSIEMSEQNWSNLSQISKTLILTGYLIEKLGFKNFIEVIDEVEMLREKLEDIAVRAVMREEKEDV